MPDKHSINAKLFLFRSVADLVLCVVRSPLLCITWPPPKAQARHSLRVGWGIKGGLRILNVKSQSGGSKAPVP